MIGEVNRNKFSKDDINAINKFIRKTNKISFYGRESIQKEYEQELSKYCNREYCLLTNSGTNALFSAYFALNLSEGDEVIVQTQTFWASVMPLFLLNLKPILVDSEKESGNIDIKEIEKNITKNTKAIVVTYFPGFKTRIKEIVKIAKKHNLKIIEDISLCIGAKIEEKPLGSFGDIACFSLGSTKLLSGGQGGGLVTNNREYYERAVLLGYFGERSLNEIMNPFYRQFSNVGYGLNNRMHVLSIAVSKEKFGKIDLLIRQRHKRFSILLKYLKKLPFLIIPKEINGFEKGSWHGLYVFFNPKECKISLEEYIKELNRKGISINRGLHYPLLHQTQFFQTKQDGLRGLKKNNNKQIYSKNQFPNSEICVKNLVSLPLFLDEPLEEIHKYGKKLLKISREILKNG